MVSTARTEGPGDSFCRRANMGEPANRENRRNSCADVSGDENQNEETNRENVEDCEQDTEKSESEDESNENEVSVSSSKSQDILDPCSESLASSDSNKENIDSNLLQNTCVEFQPSECVITEHNLGEYENTDQIPLPQLLKIHVKQLVSGFEFGEATKRRAQENMKTARDKKRSEDRRSVEVVVTDGDKDSDFTKPCCSNASSEAEHKTPHSRKRQRLAESKMNVVNPDKEFSRVTRRIPNCIIHQPDCKEVWTFMIFKEEASLKLRNPRLFSDFKSVTPRMRAILLDWLMEVSAVYHLRRVTYYLSVDYFDRFLSIRPDIPKSLLQLVGITCLYIAAKVEEIYPPNLSEFSYVCDGACKSNEMVSCELLILNSLGWEVVLTTPSDWLNLYMQLHFKSSDIVRSTLNLDFNRDFIFPQYSAYQFTRASQLMDLLSLDPGFLKFGYSVVAAGAMYFMYGEEIALAVSGLSWEQLKPCVDYMEVFYTIIKDCPDPRLHSCLGGPHPEEANKFSTGLLKRIQNGPKNENYSFQTHVASMDYFEKATIYRLTRYREARRNSTRGLQEESVSTQPETPAAEEKADASSTHSDHEDEGDGNPQLNECPSEENAGNSLIEDLEQLTNGDTQQEVPDETLMSLDEIFELILSQDENKSSHSE